MGMKLSTLKLTLSPQRKAKDLKLQNLFANKFIIANKS
ncbi:hypothetical protein PBAL39_04913 [Pedobacter sp. BAL39]|nr:hypothetical protein PBAL39_04913 [Pedobacter sp. BAL39]